MGFEHRYLATHCLQSSAADCHVPGSLCLTVHTFRMVSSFVLREISPSRGQFHNGQSTKLRFQTTTMPGSRYFTDFRFPVVCTLSRPGDISRNKALPSCTTACAARQRNPEHVVVGGTSMYSERRVFQMRQGCQSVVKNCFPRSSLPS